MNSYFWACFQCGEHAFGEKGAMSYGISEHMCETIVDRNETFQNVMDFLRSNQQSLIATKLVQMTHPMPPPPPPPMPHLLNGSSADLKTKNQIKNLKSSQTKSNTKDKAQLTTDMLSEMKVVLR